MIIGVPKEIMIEEGRIAITPKGVAFLVEAGHKVMVQNQAGEKSGYSNADFLKAGASIENSSQSIYQAEMVVKVKEPQEEEYELLKKNGIIFAFLHLPANPILAEILQKKNITALAYEGVQLANGQRPILQPMSEIAGERAVEEGMRYLKKDPKNILVAVLGGAGVVGQAAIKTAQAMGSSIISLDLPEKLKNHQSNNYKELVSTPENIQKAIKEADLLVGAVASPGDKAEKLVSRKMLFSMKPNSVIVDVAIDEGGCIETSRPTDQKNPIFIEEGIIHYCVKNIPGAVPKKSTPALTSVTLPYIIEISNKKIGKAIKENPILAKGVHIYQSKITNKNLAEALNKRHTPLETLL